LHCNNQHQFEGWFKNEQEYKRQFDAHMVCCPFCDSHDISNQPTAESLAILFSHDLLEQSVSNRLTNIEKHAIVEQLSDYIDPDVDSDFTPTVSEFKFELIEKESSTFATEEESQDENHPALDLIIKKNLQ